MWGGRSERYLPLVAIAVSTIVFLNVLGNGFYADDYFHLYDCANGPFWRTLFTPFGGHMLFVYNAVFLTLFKVFGLNPAAFFAVLIVVHGGSIYLIYSIIKRLTGQPHLAAFGATLWGMCPVNAGSLSFISVLGHVFATAAVLGVVLDLVRLEESERAPRAAVLVRIYCLLLVASFSFGVGLGVAIGFAAIFFTWNPTPQQRTRITLLFGSLMILLPLIYFGASQQQPFGPSFGVAEMPAALVRFLLVGLGALLGGPLLVGEVALFPETRVLTAAMVLGALGITGIAIGMVRASRPMRARMLAMGGLIVCGYGLIAIARYWILADFPTPILRYHYLGPALYSVLFCVSLSVVFAKTKLLQRNGAPLYFGWLLVVIIPYNMAVEKSSTAHVFAHQHYETLISLNRDIRIRAMNDGPGPIYLENTRFETGNGALSRGTEFPGLAAFYIVTHPEDDFDGRPIRFYTHDETLLESTRAEAGSRIAKLLVSVEEKNEHDRKKKRPLLDR